MERILAFMTNKNLNLNNTNKNIPFLLSPTGKDYLWGGNRLNEDFEKGIDISPLAECWECSTHPDGPSYAVSGEFQGMSLSEILEKHPEFLGTHPRTDKELPILVKLIDAREDLSVQVHPNDEYANEFENGQLGKTEMWYVLDAEKDAHLIYGMSHKVDKKTFKNALIKSMDAPKDDTTIVDKFFQKVPVHKGDLFYIEAGTIHAIGGGILIAEVQESSNLTYRMYDFNREDKNGNRRELHIDKALDVANLESAKNPKQPMRVLKYKPGCATELLCRCKYFEVNRMIINSKEIEGGVEYQSDSSSFRVLLCTKGRGYLAKKNGSGSEQSVKSQDNTEELIGDKLEFKAGQCIFVPADSVCMELNGRAELLDVRC